MTTGVLAGAMVTLTLSTASVLRVAELTVNRAEALKGPLKAVMVTVPGVPPLAAIPVRGLIVTTLGLEENQMVSVVTTRSPPGCPVPRKDASVAAYGN